MKSAGGGIRTHEGLRHRVSQILGGPEGSPKLGTTRLRGRTVLPLRPGSRLVRSTRQRLGYPRSSASVSTRSAGYYLFEAAFTIGSNPFVQLEWSQTISAKPSEYELWYVRLVGNGVILGLHKRRPLHGRLFILNSLHVGRDGYRLEEATHRL